MAGGCTVLVFVSAHCIGWTSPPTWHGFGSDLITAAVLCIPVLLGMLFVRAVFQSRGVRVLYDVLGLMIWASILLMNWTAQCAPPEAAPAGGEILAIVAVLTIGAVVITSGAGLIFSRRNAKPQGGT